MGLQNALYNGVSGLKANTTGLEVTGNNIANLNTVGFKASRANFMEVLSQNVPSADGTSQIGRGVELSSISRIFTQGAFETTGIVTDLAIAGKGFFIIRSGDDKLFTRAGQFHVDNEGYLVDPSGAYLQGYRTSDDGTITSALSDIKIDTNPINPSATTSAFISANLDSNSEVISAAWDPDDPVNTSNFSTAISVYDSLGNEHTLNIYFRKESDNTWHWYALVDGGEVVGGTAGTNVQVGDGRITFTNDGALDTETVLNQITVSFKNGAEPNQTIDLDFGDSITTDSGTGLTGTTQYKLTSAVNFQSQDGYAAGHLLDLDIDTKGVLYGIYSNGQKVAMYKIPLADFKNYDGLKQVGNSHFRATQASGSPIISEAGVGAIGTINARTLENSNVDLSSELVKLIVYQRGFQANSRTVRSTNEVMQDLMNIV